MSATPSEPVQPNPPAGDSATKPDTAPGFQPFVPADTKMPEFTARAVILGLIMTVILGAANAYLGLRAGMTIAATYPAAIIAMAVLRRFKGSILEENIARTVGSIGESIAAGAIFTIPAFVLSETWPDIGSTEAYLKSTALMIVGGLLGIFFVTLLRRVMVEDRDLKFPESVAAAEIHKAGQRGMGAIKSLVQSILIGGAVYLAGAAKLFTASREFIVAVGSATGDGLVRLGAKASAPFVKVGGTASIQAPSISPAYLGVGYIIGPELGALNFAGGLLAWGLFVPLLTYFLGAHVTDLFQPGVVSDLMKEAAEASSSVSPDDIARAVSEATSTALWKFIVRPIAVGGMLVGAATTLYRMRKNLSKGLKRAVSDLQKSAGSQLAQVSRLDRDLSMRIVFGGLALVVLMMVAVYFWFTDMLVAAIMAALVMAVAGFFFAAVSGNLVGMIGSSNNPISGLTLSTLIIAALLMVIIGVSGVSGVAAVLGVAAVVCVSSAVAGEMLQDLKVGHLLGGTPAKMQAGDIIGIFVSGAVMFFPLVLMHQANITSGGTGFGDKNLAAPQAGLMAALAQGIVGGEMAWPLVIVGILMGLASLLIRVRSPMLLFVGMYLPLETTFAIFVGGVIRWLTDRLGRRRNLNAAQLVRTENAGVLVASGLIAGEALVGLIIAAVVFLSGEKFPSVSWPGADWLAPLVLLALAALLIFKPLAVAGAADEPPPPAAIT